jgi:hypothetical protein
MNLIHPASLTSTLESTADEFFNSRPIEPACRQELAAFLISRQIISGSNSGFFIPFASESWTHLRLFTGETLQTEFACRHLTLIESARVLLLLSIENEAVAKSLQRADRRMAAMCYSQFCAKGECKHLTVAYMRYLALSPTADAPAHLQSLLTSLSGLRDGKGKWHGFPYFFTLSMLSEMRDPLAAQELDYAAPHFEKQSHHQEPNDPYSKRRSAILAKLMTRSVNNADPLLLGQYG